MWGARGITAGQEPRRKRAAAVEGVTPKGGTTVNKLYSRAYLAVASLREREEGQALVEYALLLSLIAIVSIGVLTVLGHSVSSIFSNISNSL
jgi:pilus assembly protein Flp/PilA